MEHLFKYRSFDDCGRSMSALVNRELWFSTGDRFNDPFDCTTNLPMVLASSKSVRKFIIESTDCVSKLKASGFQEEEINEKVNLIVENLLSNDKLIESKDTEITYEIISKNLKNSLVFCLSKTASNTLLWSHYAEFHTGFCVRFKKKNLLDSLEIYHHDDINYTAKPFDVVEDININDELHLAKIICFRKSPDWRYEQEYRLIHSELSTVGSLAKPFFYPRDVVDEIYFGVNALNENKIELMEALKDQNIKFRNMLIPTDNMTYELQVGPVIKSENELIRHS